MIATCFTEQLKKFLGLSNEFENFGEQLLGSPLIADLHDSRSNCVAALRNHNYRKSKKQFFCFLILIR